MAPIKTKGRKTKGLLTPVSLTKRTERAGRKKLVSATTAQGQHPTIVEARTAALQDDVSLKLDALRRMRSYPVRRWPEGGGGDKDEAVSTLSVTVG